MFDTTASGWTVATLSLAPARMFIVSMEVPYLQRGGQLWKSLKILRNRRSAGRGCKKKKKRGPCRSGRKNPADYDGFSSFPAKVKTQWSMLGTQRLRRTCFSAERTRLSLCLPISRVIISQVPGTQLLERSPRVAPFSSVVLSARVSLPLDMLPQG